MGESFRGRDYRLFRELVYALENARSRLAIAIAAENKTTTRDRRQYYLDTENRLRQCIRDIRQEYPPDDGKPSAWLHALNLLKQPQPSHESKEHREAQQLCQLLYQVLELVEQKGDE